MGLEDKRYYAQGKFTNGKINFLLSEKGTQLWYSLPGTSVWAIDREGKQAKDWWKVNYKLFNHNQIVDILWNIKWD